MKRVLILLILLAFVFPANAATIYRWVDKDGNVNFTDDYNEVPSSYRDRVEIRNYASEGGTPSYILEMPPLISPRTKEEIRTDVYGRDETWWREKARPWNEQLKEATANYEKVHSKFMKKAGELSVRRYGSRTQYKMNLLQLDGLKEEMMKYEALISEAAEMLEKLSKEAKETKANPEWLK